MIFATFVAQADDALDWQNVYSSLVKIIPEQQRDLQREAQDSIEYRIALVNSELLFSVTIKAMDSLKITEGKVEYLHQLYDAKYSLNKYDVEMYDVANRLGIHYYDKDSISEARKYFTTAFKDN